MKSILLLIAFFIVGIYPVYAHDHHTHNMRAENTCSAMGIAVSRNQADQARDNLQLTAGMGSCNGANALAFGVSKRLSGIFINSVIGVEGNNTGYGIGITIPIK